MGKLIIIEGVDGSGKTTLIEGLKKAIWSDFVFNFKNPPKEMDSFQQNAFARGEYVSAIRIFKVLLEQDKMIICDRFHLGEYAYGPIMRNYPEWLAKETVASIEEMILEEIGPSHVKVIILSASPNIALDRIAKKTPINQNLEYLTKKVQYERINDRYLKVESRLPVRLIVTDLRDPKEILEKSIDFIMEK